MGIEFAQALRDQRMRGNIRRALDGLAAKRQAAFSDRDEWTRLQDQGRAIRAHALSRLPELLEALERQCTANGIRVHWAETCDQANRLVLDILRQHQTRMLVKGKSMVTEELGLNAFLEAQGIEVVETDLGELIVQLTGERPFHIIAPAIHKDRQQIAELFRARFPDIPYSEDAETLTATARRILREKFRSALAGLTGVNFAVAETGTLVLVENEGNGRMCTTAPEVHIAVTGIEKVIPRLDQLPPLLTLLTRSATGQPITTYVNLIGAPRRAGELDGPKEVHLILLDNGRSRLCADPELQATLRCIRCGACMNHCPVYTRLGGHAYGTVYTGPIGSLLEPQRQGLAVAGALADASSLCGACSEVCPVGIPIPDLLRRLRAEGIGAGAKSHVPGRGSRRKLGPATLWRLWAWLHADPSRYRLMSGLLSKTGGLLPRLVTPWNRSRLPPRLAPENLHRLARKAGFTEDCDD
ncbi:MAG: iron-sulfur cluster-binding protein [Candidatus Thiosymbion ectosymbiont of Robbea hypermnestra]|nr:iron-sulfur cluster-binding protein [Candidatus Thiosymbion ectosymbiont of Robbea hypermnestra]